MSNEEFIIDFATADCENAYVTVLPEATALAVEKLVAINTDVPECVLLGIRVLARLPPFVTSINALPEFELQIFNKFRARILALYSVQTKYSHALTPPPELPTQLAKATNLRDLFLGDSGALVAHGLMNPKAIAMYKGLNGYKNVAFDLAGLVQLLTEMWPQIEGKVIFTKAELDEARQFCQLFVQNVAYREDAPNRIAELADIRQRMYSLFCESYDQVRRAISFLRWNQGDVDTIVPSLFAGRGGPAKKAATSDAKAKEESAKNTTDDAKAPATSNGTTPANKLPVGHPDATPFTSV
jgi:hypothetical protein